MDNKPQKLIDKCPCPIHFGSPLKGRSGFYHPSDKLVVIDDYIPYAEKYAVLVHESQHAKCHHFNCICWNQGDTEIEYHAYKVQVIRCLNYIPALKETVELISYVLGQEMEYPDHARACKKLITTKLWQKALKLCGLSLT